MKKLYAFIAVAVLGCATLTAGGRFTQPKASELSKPSYVAETTSAATVTLADNVLTSLSDFEGELTLSCSPRYYGMDNTYTLTSTITNAATNEITLSGLVPVAPQFVVKATVDLTAGTLTIKNNQYMGADADGDVYFYLKDVENSQILEGMSSAVSTVGQIEGRTITFPTYDIWAVGTPDDEELGFWFMSNANVITIGDDSGPDPNEGWVAYDYAKFVDGFMIPGWGITDPSQVPLTVLVQQNKANPYLFRLDNPYSVEESAFYSQMPEVLSNGYIEFDITDGGFVKVNPVFCGITDGDKFYCVNPEGFYSIRGIGKEAIGTVVSNYEASTYADGVVDIPMARFIVNGTSSMYAWKNGAGVSVASSMKAKITFLTMKPESQLAAIDTIGADSNNAPVEYFNLQGVRIIAPAAGQPVIMRQGTKVTKTIAE